MRCHCRYCRPSPRRLRAAFAVGRSRALCGESRDTVVEEAAARYPADSEAQAEVLRAFDLHVPAESRAWV